MKKHFAKTIFLILICFISVLSTSSLYSEDEGTRVLVVCFSRDGHTKMVAEKLAEKFNADFELLIDTKNRTGALGNMSAGNDAVMHRQTTIKPLQHNPGEYDVILIGTPAWFSNMTPAVRTFISQNDLSGKTIAYFATCHRVGADKATAQMAQLVEKGSSKTALQLPLTHNDLENELDIKIDNFYAKLLKKTNKQ